MARPRAFVFDAYGTLFDVHSVTRLADTLWPGRGAALSQLWRTKQLEYTWLRSLMGRYADFGRVTEDALRYSCEALGLPFSDESHGRLMDAYLRLETANEDGTIAPTHECRVEKRRAGSLPPSFALRI